jgi:prenylcysteine oxidase/farnesylcysteine lyase
MRTPLLAVSAALLTNANAFKISSAIDWLYSGAAHAVSVDVVSHKVAVVGAGAAGSSSAFWISKAKSRANVAVEVDVYEKEAYIGGREHFLLPQRLFPFDIQRALAIYTT